MINLKLEGILGTLFTKEISLYAKSGIDLVNGLKANFPMFEAVILNLEKQGIKFSFRIGNQFISKNQINIQFDPKVRSAAITPIPFGAGGSGLFKILGGAALLGLGLSGVGFLGISASTLALSGGAMLLSGVSSLFGRVNKPENDEDQGKRSLVFSSPQQSLKEGGRMPIVYGAKVLVGHYIISSRIRTVLS